MDRNGKIICLVFCIMTLLGTNGKAQIFIDSVDYNEGELIFLSGDEWGILGGNGKVFAKVPKVCGMLDFKAEVKVNELFKKRALENLKIYRENGTASKQGFRFHSKYWTSYEGVDSFSIVQYQIIYPQWGRPSQISYGLTNYDTLRCKEIELKDFFTLGEQEFPALAKLVEREKSSPRHYSFWTGNRETPQFKRELPLVNSQTPFYFSPQGLVLIYRAGEIADEKSGDVFFLVPWGDVWDQISDRWNFPDPKTIEIPPFKIQFVE